MRVAFVVAGLLEYTTGLANGLSSDADVSLHLLDAARFLIEEGWHSPDLAEFRRSYEPSLKPDVRLAWVNPWPWRKDPRGVLGILQLVQSVRRVRPHVIHLHDGADYRLFLALMGLREFPWVVTIHDATPHLGEEDFYAGWEGRLQQWIRRNASGIIVHGEEQRQILVRNGRLEAGKIEVVPHGAYDFYRRWLQPGIVEERSSVLFFGRIRRYKGLDLFIQAEPLITAQVPDAKFVIAGSGDSLEPYRRMMVHPQRFTVYNYRIPYDEVAELFQKASVVALPYREASQSGVLALAYAFGKPVVATQVGSIPEMVEDGETGLLVNPDDPRALAEAIVRLLGDDSLRARMGRRARERAESDLSWNRLAKKVLKIYESVVDEGMTSP